MTTNEEIAVYQNVVGQLTNVVYQLTLALRLRVDHATCPRCGAYLRDLLVQPDTNSHHQPWCTFAEIEERAKKTLELVRKEMKEMREKEEIARA